ncbi:hypothetical protein WAF17_07045 [Bernardetia sp. ABR2-2B]|uniref:hypothetical protein n=1 Tax=Bernardetia sp. ABR2-2B TaxID=3127472 RepID=UPI0030D1B15C
MKFIFKLSFTLLCIASISSCNNYRYEKSAITGINIYSTVEENERFVRETFTENEIITLAKELGIKDTTTLGKIRYEIVNDGKSVNIEFTFIDEAIKYKEPFKKYVVDLLNNKAKQDQLNATLFVEAEMEAQKIMQLIKYENYDEVWENRISQHLKWRMTKPEFFETWKKINEIIVNYENKELTERVILEKIEGIENDLISLNYLYGNDYKLEIVLENTDKMLLATFWLRPIS